MKCQQINEQAAGFAKPDAVKHLARGQIERPGQVVLFIRAWRPGLLLSAFLHPRIADLGKQLDVEFVSKQQELFRAEALEKPPDSRQLPDPLRIIILKEMSKQRYVPPYNIASVYVGLGQKELSFDCLEKAYEDRDVRLVFLKVEPEWDELRADPRFTSLLQRVGF